MTEELRNWAGNHHYRADRLHRPESLDELAEVVRAARHLRVLGSRHSFNDIVDSDGDLVSVAGLPRVFELDPAARTVTVDAATRYGDVGPALHEAGFGLPAMASLPHISIAGSCATGTHGSGDETANLATSVTGLELITASGELTRLERGRDGDTFAGAAVHLGALGVVVRVTLELEPSYQIRQDVYEDLALDAFVRDAATLTAAANSVSFFTDWREPRFHQVWLKRRVVPGDSFTPEPDLAGATLATSPLHPIPGHDAAACTEQLGVPGPWHERLPHFRLDHTPSSGAELQTEYFVARSDVGAAVSELFALGERLAPLVLVSEIRTIAADDLWLSPAWGRPSAAIHFTWRPDADAVGALLPDVERTLAPFAPRPHWAKIFGLAPDDVRAAYPRSRDFAALAERLDPEGVFANDFVRRYVLGTR